MVLSVGQPAPGVALAMADRVAGPREPLGHKPDCHVFLGNSYFRYQMLTNLKVLLKLKEVSLLKDVIASHVQVSHRPFLAGPPK